MVHNKERSATWHEVERLRHLVKRTKEALEVYQARLADALAELEVEQNDN